MQHWELNASLLLQDSIKVGTLGPKIRKQDMKLRLADLDLTNQRSAQVRSISVPYIRTFLEEKQQCRKCVAWVCAE